MYTAEAPRFDSEHTSFVTKRKPPLSIPETEPHSKTLKTTSFDEGVRAASEIVAKRDDVIGVPPAASNAPQPEAKSAFKVLKIAIREYCFLRYTSFNEAEKLRELEMGSALHCNVNLVLAEPLYSIRSARGQAGSSYDVFCKEKIENPLWFMSNVMAPRAQDHILCTDLMFFHWSKNHRQQTERVKNLKTDSYGLNRGPHTSAE